jgi:hypothetical protein
MATILSNRRLPNTTGWQDRHDLATKYPAIDKGEALAPMLQSWAWYLRGYQAMYDESMLADDHILGAAWKEVGLGLRQLLNGSAGRLDCGTLDKFIIDTFTEAGFTEEDL